MTFQLLGTDHVTNPPLMRNYLNEAQIKTVLQEWRYKPGWTFTLYRHRWEGLCIDIAVTMPNGYNTDETVDLNMRVPIPPLIDFQHFVDWLMWRLARAELHEMREFSIFAGKRVDDPHAEEVRMI